MGQQPATFAGRTRAQGREHATTNVMTDFERDLLHRRVAGIQLPPGNEDQLANLKHTVLTQYTLKKGLQVFGPKGTEAVFAEMKQLHDCNVCEPIKEKESVKRTKEQGVRIPDVPKAKEMWADQRKRLCRWTKTTSLDHQRRGDITYRLH